MISFAQYFLLEKKSKLKQYPIQIPPKTKAECIKICSKTKMADGPWYMNSGGDDKEMSFKDAAKGWDIETTRHETVHALQEINIPGIFKGLPALSHKFVSTEKYKQKHYYSRPPEIMAFAYDTAMGVDVAKNEKTFKAIGGEVYELFTHYVDEYKKVL
jgi:hypothetical protein